MTSETFDRARLSVREDAILEAAIEGLTDIQIAQRLDISQSTVNSYWVRIRGKLGQLSRTELVALALKQQARSQMDAVNAQLEALREEVRGHARISEDYGRAEILRVAFDALPEGALVCCEMSVIRYANPRLEAMFGYAAGELVNEPVAILVPPSERAGETERIREYMKAPRPMRMGLSSVVYAQRKGGELFRVAMLFDGRPTSTGMIATCLVRDFATEIETRRQFTSAWS